MKIIINWEKRDNQDFGPERKMRFGRDLKVKTQEGERVYWDVCVREREREIIVIDININYNEC